MKRTLIFIALLFVASYCSYQYFYKGDFKILPAGYYSGAVYNLKNQPEFLLLLVSDGSKNTFYFHDNNLKLKGQHEVTERGAAEFQIGTNFYKFRQATASPFQGSALIPDSNESYSWELKEAGPVSGSLEIKDSEVTQRENLLAEFKQQKLRLDLISQKIKDQQTLNQEMEELIANPDKLITLMQQKKEQAGSELAILKQKILDSQKKLKALNEQQANLLKFSTHGSLVLAAREALALEGQIYQQLNSRPSFQGYPQPVGANVDSLRSDILAEKDAIYLLRYKLKLPQNENL